MAVADWSTSASLNTTVGGIDIAPGCARANMDDMGRAIMAEAKAKFNEYVSVLDYGTPTTDIGNSLQLAHDALGADGGIILIPSSSSNYPLLTTAAFTKPVALIGGALRSCEILCGTGGLSCITTNNWIRVEGIEFTMVSGALTTSTIIKQLAASSNHGSSLIRNCRFIGGLYCVWLERANSITIENCNFGSYLTYGLFSQNGTSTDEGDSFLTNCTFGGGSTTAAIGAELRNSGWYCSNNKANGAHDAVIEINAATGNLGDYTFVGGSLEGYTNAAIRVVNSASWVATKILITGIQFSSGSAYHIDLTGKAQNVCVTGNTINSTSASSGIGIRGTASVTDVTITGNQFYQILTAMDFSAVTNVGLSIAGNRFGDDVTNIFSGEDPTAPNTKGSTKTITVSRYKNNASAVTWADCYKWRGYGTARVRLNGIVQGVGNTAYSAEYVFSSTTRQPLIAAVTAASAVDVQIATSGSDNVLQVRRNSAGGGTAIDVMVELQLDGYPTSVVRA